MNVPSIAAGLPPIFATPNTPPSAAAAPVPEFRTPTSSGRSRKRSYAWLDAPPPGPAKTGGSGPNEVLQPPASQPSIPLRTPAASPTAQARRNQVNEQKLLASLQRAADSLPESSQAHLNLGVQLLARNRPVQALQSLWAAEALQPGDLHVQGALSIAMQRLGQLDAATEHEATFRGLVSASVTGDLPQAQQRARERYEFGTAMWSEVMKNGA